MDTNEVIRKFSGGRGLTAAAEEWIRDTREAGGDPDALAQMVEQWATTPNRGAFGPGLVTEEERLYIRLEMEEAQRLLADERGEWSPPNL